MNILIVEDNSLLRQTMADILSCLFPDISLLEAATGEEAMEVVRRERPHLVFMDIQLPGESGLRVTGRIKTEFPHIIIIIHTNFDLREYRKPAADAGADHLLSKQETTLEDIAGLVGRYTAAR